MKRNYFVIALMILTGIISGGNLKAQSSGNSTEILKGNLKPDSLNTFISFSPVSLDGKTYVRWLVKNDKKDGVFVVERSADGIEFEALGFKDRIGTQLLVNLFYSFTDQEPLPGESHYRIMQIGADNSYNYSSVVKVNTSNNPRQTGSAASAEPVKK